MEGFVGRLFREFGVVVAGAVLISAFVSLTLTPVLNVKMTKNVHKHSWFYRKTEPFFRGMENGYRNALTSFMKIRWMAWVIVVACVGIFFIFGGKLKSELAPMEDRSQFRLQLTAPEGASFDYTDAFVEKVTNLVLDSVPEKRTVLSITAPGFATGASNTGMVRATLTNPKERSRSQKEIVAMLNRNLSKFSDGRVDAVEEQTIQQNRRGGRPVQFVIQNNNFNKLSQVVPKFLEAANKSTIVLGADADLKFNKPELRITVDRLKASQLGVNVDDISGTLNLSLSNRRLGYFIKNGKQYDVLGQVARSDRDDPADLKDIYVRNVTGNMISLDNLITFQEATTPSNIYHFNRFKSVTISANLQPGKTIGDGVEEMRRIAKEVLDDTFVTSLSGLSREYSESSSNTLFAFILAIGLIILVLAAQFESFIDPLIIIITVPLAFAGAVLSLWIFGQTLNIFSRIGMIMLVGLVTKNGILIVEFANQNRRKKGMKKTEAVIYAATMRLRPILMTSLAMSLGALPIALSIGDAATSRIPLGIVIVGGILFSLVLTLFVIPAIYSFLSTKKKKSEMELMDNKAAEEAAHHS